MTGVDVVPTATDDPAWQYLADASTDVTYRFEVAGDALALTYVNPAAESVLGYTPHALMADPGLVLRAMSPEDRTTTWRLLTRPDPDADGPGHTRTLRWWHPEGRWVELSCTHVRTYVAGRLVAIQGVIVDVARDRRQQDAVAVAAAREAAAEAEAQALARTRASLQDALSHEVRTPLTAIAGFLEVLGHHGRALSHEEHDRFVGVALQNTHRLHQLLEDLLDTGRVARGELRPAPWLIDLDDHVRRVVPALPTHDHEVVVDPAAPGQRVTFDPDALTRILRHLVGNAVRHTPAGTRVLVRTEATTPREAHLVVEDDGPGLDDDPEGLFQPFSQGRLAVGSASPGLGLGLHVVRQLAQLHGGRAWAEPNEPHGARVRVALLGA